MMRVKHEEEKGGEDEADYEQVNVQTFGGVSLGVHNEEVAGGKTCQFEGNKQKKLLGIWTRE